MWIWDSNREEKTSGPFVVNFVNRRTAREATIVEAIAAGTLKMMDITALRFINMNTVARRLARKLHTKKKKRVSALNVSILKRQDLRNNEEDESIVENEAHKPAPAVPREQKFVCRERKYEKVERHCVNERRRKNSVVRLCDDTSARRLPSGTDEETMKKQRPMSENDEDQGNNDIQ